MSTSQAAEKWKTCPECHKIGLTHVSRAELEADPIGTWRELWRAGTVAVRWHDHPCDAVHDPDSPDERYWPKAWAVFGEWGVEEVGHVDMQESHQITPTVAMNRLAGKRRGGPPPSPVKAAVRAAASPDGTTISRKDLIRAVQAACPDVTVATISAAISDVTTRCSAAGLERVGYGLYRRPATQGHH